MDEHGVDTYLLLLDPASLHVLWANEKVEDRVAARTGESAVGKLLVEVIPFAEALGLPRRLHAVAAAGDSDHIRSIGFSTTGDGTVTTASLYRLPSGELLVASEYTEAGVRR